MLTCIKPKNKISGVFSVPGDKSISHRALILSSLMEGKTEIKGFLKGEDCISTINCLRALGTQIIINGVNVTVFGNGLHGFKKPKDTLYVGNSGTTIRLLCGILAAQPFDSIITGDESIKKRPMGRIIEPLSLMGADIFSNNKRAPLSVRGGADIRPINYMSKISSAQVKSCILLSGLYAKGKTKITEPFKSRDHTELMLKYLGADIEASGTSVTLSSGGRLLPKSIIVCGDISSASFLIVAALICQNSDILIKNVGVNSTRTGIITVLREMGANIEILNKRNICGEFVADIKVKYSELYGTTIEGSIIPSLIDEIPIIATAALFAKGRTIIKDASELRYKETDRLKALSSEMKKMGAHIEETSDGLIIEGGLPIIGARVDSLGDHRLAMSLAIAALRADGETLIEEGDCVNISYPGFYDVINRFE